VPGGAEEVLREILRVFPGVVHTAQFNPDRFPWLKGVEVRSTWVSSLPLSKTKHYLYAPLLPFAYRGMNLREFDLVLTDSHSFAHFARKAPGALNVCYYHTPARSLWVPEIDDRASRCFVHRFLASRMRPMDLEASNNPDVILANSQTTAERIKRIYGRDVDEVIYPPVDTAKWSDVPRESEDEGFLVWGRLIPYKRLDLAILAARKLGVRLNIVGSGPYEGALKEMASGASNIQFHGRLSDDDLKALMARSRAVLFPGYEDFGIIPVEAMAAGLPVVAFGQGGASETVTEGFGVQFMEQSADSLADAMTRLQSLSFDPEHLRRHAQKFDKEVFKTRYSAAVDRAWERHRI
jgi:glycosyltransferase involved in cell wall biosynthesis